MGTSTTSNRRLTQAYEPPATTDRPLVQPQYRVVLAGTCFFHIEETATGRVRGFRADHNEACYLARRLEQSSRFSSIPHP